ncbi:phosphodiesterase [Aspergillus sp. HF37]|nr:phosphodiesterase [Aspergillus sp. HF37]
MAHEAAFQVIVLGPTGGPREDKVTGLLVRSTSTHWSSNSTIAVDAGTLLAGIIRTLENSKTECEDGKSVVRTGPFAGLSMPCKTPQANSAHIFRNILGAILVTHPHLDHVSGLAINTPMLEAGSGPKSLTALPSIVTAIKNHMFNDIIWPNLSDEDGGAGLLTYQRLVEGGNPRFGRGDTRGYVRACNGLLTKCLGRVGSAVFADPLMVPSRTISVDHTEAGMHSPPRSPCLIASNPKEPGWTTVESSAFFIRDQHTASEIIVFGDVEPDSLSLDPRNKHVWEVAAPKISNGTLRAIFIECSYNDSIDDGSLYGHLCPRHLIAELSVLATKVVEFQHPNTKAAEKRKREDSSPDEPEDVSPRSKRSQSVTVGELQLGHRDPSPRVSTRRQTRSRKKDGDYIGGSADSGHDEQVDGDPKRARIPALPENIQADGLRSFPLTGLSVYIIHIKDGLTDGPPPGDQILLELRKQGEAARLGCEFRLPDPAEGIWI